MYGEGEGAQGMGHPRRGSRALAFFFTLFNPPPPSRLTCAAGRPFSSQRLASSPMDYSEDVEWAGFVCGGGGGGSGWAPQSGRLFKLDFPSAKFWVKFFGWVKRTPPPLIHKA